MPAPPVEVAINMSEPGVRRSKDMSFKVTPDFHRRFKIEAAQRGMGMNDLLELAFDHYVETFPKG